MRPTPTALAQRSRLAFRLKPIRGVQSYSIKLDSGLAYSVLSLKPGGNQVSAKSPKWRQGDKTCWTKPRSSASVAAMEIVKWGRSAECGAWLAIDREVGEG